MPSYQMLCRLIRCYAVLSDVMSSYLMLCRLIRCYVALLYVLSSCHMFYVVLSYVMTSYHLSCRLIKCYVVLSDVIAPLKNYVVLSGVISSRYINWLSTKKDTGQHQVNIIYWHRSINSAPFMRYIQDESCEHATCNIIMLRCDLFMLTCNII